MRFHVLTPRSPSPYKYTGWEEHVHVVLYGARTRTTGRNKNVPRAANCNPVWTQPTKPRSNSLAPHRAYARGRVGSEDRHRDKQRLERWSHKNPGRATSFQFMCSNRIQGCGCIIFARSICDFRGDEHPKSRNRPRKQ
mmetsp:Transcript_6609/g.11661  ORF Transcript_6609/g.11661 Transcript_6609/m.11661 type:complete len:138 (+) Transcript_6609:6230-6643(+)